MKRREEEKKKKEKKKEEEKKRRRKEEEKVKERSKYFPLTLCSPWQTFGNFFFSTEPT